jgi:5-methylcytosine-specific restriction protein A
MLSERRDLIAEELVAGTGASIAVAVNSSKILTGLDIWFNDLNRNHGPIAELRPYGLKAHRVELSFGRFAGDAIRRIQLAPDEDRKLSRALIASIRDDAEVVVVGQSLETWTVSDGSFRITSTLRHSSNANGDDTIVLTCRDVIVPMMAAMAELIGYDPILGNNPTDENALEGAVTLIEVSRRERNPRNKLLCLRIHGHQCKICNLKPAERYGTAGAITEVHHLQPVSLLDKPRAYDPRTDLVPLCPNCHRAVHTRRPVPFTVDELKALIESSKCQN